MEFGLNNKEKSLHFTTVNIVYKTAMWSKLLCHFTLKLIVVKQQSLPWDATSMRFIFLKFLYKYENNNTKAIILLYRNSMRFVFSLANFLNIIPLYALHMQSTLLNYSPGLHLHMKNDCFPCIALFVPGHMRFPFFREWFELFNWGDQPQFSFIQPAHCIVYVLKQVLRSIV